MLNRRFLLALSSGAQLILVACSAPELALPSSVTNLPGGTSILFDYKVGPGDVLRVNVAGHPDLSSTPYKSNVPGSPVDGSGCIQLPYIGEVNVSAQTVHEIKGLVEAKLQKYLKRPLVDVAVIDFGSQRIFVLGEVQSPGMFVLDRPMTALQALALTGGFTDDANREQIALFHGPIAAENLVTFNAITLEGAEGNFLQSNDLIFVPQRDWAEASQMARDLVPILQLVSLPIGTARDVALFQDIRNR